MLRKSFFISLQTGPLNRVQSRSEDNSARCWIQTSAYYKEEWSIVLLGTGKGGERSKGDVTHGKARHFASSLLMTFTQWALSLCFISSQGFRNVCHQQ